VGNPFVEGSVVKGKVIEQARAKKVKILKFRRRKHSMKSMGHRQPYSEIEIESIS
ncbi:MAG: 50S ribosomal protein L21, partial [Burkholderiaceae bacterium]